MSTPIAQAISWNFWARHNYRNSWIVGAGFAGAGLLHYLSEHANKPKTAEECYAEIESLLAALHAEYDAKITAFERGYKITGNDITSKNEQLESARNQWHTQIDEEALSLLGIFPVIGMLI